MAVLQIGAHMSVAGGVSCALDHAASVGSNAVQVFTKNNRQWAAPPINMDDVARWQETMPALGIGYAVSHASYLINLASNKDELWAKSIAAHTDELQRAHTYNIRHVVLHPGSHTGAGVEFGVHRIAAALNQIHAQTPDCTDTITCLELMAGAGATMGRSFQELRAIIELVEARERIGVCVDTCHAFAAGYDLRTADTYEQFMDQLELEIGLNTVKVLHFNDSKGTLGSHLDRHEHIGEGEIGSDGFGYFLNDPRWDGVPVCIETPKDETLHEDRMNLARLIALINDTDRIPPSLSPRDEEDPKPVEVKIDIEVEKKPVSTRKRKVTRTQATATAI